MRIIVGLGNPGREYANTRHNVGFMALAELAKRVMAEPPKRRFRADVAEAILHGEKLVLVAPQTFMNLSGLSVQEVLHWYHLPIDDLLVVYDDMDLPFGTIRMRGSGSAGGHNGLSSIIQQLGTNTVPRLRMGIGRGQSAATAHVLSRFNPVEEAALPKLIDAAVEAALRWVDTGLLPAMNAVNQKPVDPEKQLSPTATANQETGQQGQVDA